MATTQKSKKNSKQKLTKSRHQSKYTNVTNHKKTVSVKLNRVNILGLCETTSEWAYWAVQKQMSNSLNISLTLMTSVG